MSLYLFIFKHRHALTHRHVHAQTWTHRHRNRHRRIYTYVCIYIHAQICTRMRARAHTHTHTHTHTHVDIFRFVLGVFLCLHRQTNGEEQALKHNESPFRTNRKPSFLGEAQLACLSRTLHLHRTMKHLALLWQHALSFSDGSSC